jgi:hypothetical protein
LSPRRRSESIRGLHAPESREEPLFVGHIGLGLAGKGVVPAVSLGTLFLSVQLADGLWPILLLAGVEHVRIAPHIMRLSHLDFWDYPVSHSLAALFGWALLFAALYAFVRRDGRAAFVLAAGVVSHWALDALTHRPDLPVLPRGPYVGLGLWNSVPGTLAVEGGLYAAGIALYFRGTRPRDAIGSWAPGILLVLPRNLARGSLRAAAAWRPGSRLDRPLGLALRSLGLLDRSASGPRFARP